MRFGAVSKQFLPFICGALLAAMAMSCAGLESRPKYPQMLADMEPFSLGSVKASFDQVFSSNVKEAELNVILHPRLNEVSLEFRQGLLSCRQFWSEANRRHFIEAKTTYNTDYDERNLTGKYAKSRAAYGKGSARYEWETFSFSTTYQSLPGLEFGYRFKGDAVYFTVLQRSAKEMGGYSNDTNLESLQFSIYFTRAQAEKLAELFNQDFILEKLGVEPMEPEENTGVEKDIYRL